MTSFAPLAVAAAATPNIGKIDGTMAFGLRPRGVLFTSGDWRSNVTVPIFDYPDVSGFGRWRGVHREHPHARQGAHDDGRRLGHGHRGRRGSGVRPHAALRPVLAHPVRPRARAGLDRGRVAVGGITTSL
jgi:hypothetical protein